MSRRQWIPFRWHSCLVGELWQNSDLTLVFFTLESLWSLIPTRKRRRRVSGKRTAQHTTNKSLYIVPLPRFSDINHRVILCQNCQNSHFLINVLDVLFASRHRVSRFRLESSVSFIQKETRDLEMDLSFSYRVLTVLLLFFIFFSLFSCIRHFFSRFTNCILSEFCALYCVLSTMTLKHNGHSFSLFITSIVSLSVTIPLSSLFPSPNIEI